MRNGLQTHLHPHTHPPVHPAHAPCTQAVAAAARKAAADAVQQQINLEVAKHARLRHAARVIARAWLAFSAPEGGRAARAALVARLQVGGGWGWVGSGVGGWVAARKVRGW